MNGCNNFCSYCIVPYVRGREVSRTVESIIDEIRFLESKGVKEITLLGQNVNSYKGEYKGQEVDFPTLLEIIYPYLDSIEFVRFESPHPKDFSDHLIRVISEKERICSHIHLPMQSGSSRILSLMNRKTTREQFIALLNKMRGEIKDAFGLDPTLSDRLKAADALAKRYQIFTQKLEVETTQAIQIIEDLEE